MTIWMIAERFNREPPSQAYSPERWLTISRRLGCFRDGRGAAKLESLGVRVGDCTSLNLTPPGTQDDPWDAEFAERVAGLVLNEIAEGDAVLMIGGRVRVALGRAVGRRGAVLSRLRVGDHATLDGATFVAVPHPSGLNRWWNDLERSERFAARYEALRLHTTGDTT